MTTPEINAAIGRSKVIHDIYTPATLNKMAATMGWQDLQFTNGSIVPPLWHWLAGATIADNSELGDDGHERLGLFIPQLPAARRMWAAGAVEFHQPIIVGIETEVRSTILDITQKQGKTGELWFVILEHVYSQNGDACLRETQTLVYRPETKDVVKKAPKPAPEGESLSQYQVNDTQLFRYSALTFNSHRIHLDRRYCATAEGDPRLVVHGPLLATLLAKDADKRVNGGLKTFSYKALSPVREDEVFMTCSSATEGGSHDLWVAGEDGGLRMTCSATGMKD